MNKKRVLLVLLVLFSLSFLEGSSVAQSQNAKTFASLSTSELILYEAEELLTYEQLGKVSEEFHIEEKNSTAAHDEYIQKTHEIRQRLETGEEFTVWRSVDLLQNKPDQLEFYAKYGIRHSVDIVKVWRNQPHCYILIRKDFDLILLNVTEESGDQISVAEVVLDDYITKPIVEPLFKGSNSGELLEISVLTEGQYLQRYFVKSGKVRNRKVTNISNNSYYLPLCSPQIWKNYDGIMSENVETTKEAENAYRELMTFNESDPLSGLNETWARELQPQTISKLAIRLLNLLGDESGKKDEVYLEGNSNWSLNGRRYVLGCWQILKFKSTLTESFFENRTPREAFLFLQREYFETLVQPRVEKQLAVMDISEQHNYIQEPKPSICPTEVFVALAMLSKAPEKEVRMTVAKSKWTNSAVLLSMMAKEQDVDVRAVLNETSSKVQTLVLESELPIPIGW